MKELPPAVDPETKRATETLKPCPKCQGKPVFRYEPGCSYSTCAMFRKDCPMTAAVPDFDPVGLADKLNAQSDDTR